ncbi:MAG: tRNA (adenosine(37)-N6)-threonylcarbamoyltransferase complex dimerization subunit type 1 TsaB [Chlamydiota bacterium]
MKNLIIDTATERSLLALAKDDRVIKELQLPIGYRHSRDLLLKIDELLAEASTSKEEVGFMTVTVGPGSYTGIRVGVAIAKSLAFAWSIPLVGVSSLEGFVPSDDGKFAALIDAKIGGAYYLLGEKQGERIDYKGKPAVAPLDKLLPQLGDLDFIVTPKKQRLAELLDVEAVWQERYPSADQLAAIGQKKFSQREYSIDGKLEILYLRKTQAEIERES